MSGTVTRRSALTAAVVAVAGGVAGFVWGRNSDAAKQVSAGGTGSGYGSTGQAASGRLLVAVDKVPDGGGVIKSGVVVTRSGSDVHAFSARCTHLGCNVNAVKHGKIYCPCHGSVFDASTGAVLQSPATAPLPKVDVTVKNGGVYTS
jgi:Rieske Fe-S protein